uniref:Uncharacterized protein n=1 Tax=Rhabditophanes sp. KR3021 TaxID=114890 RepID=A0AC35TUX6_9BILA
MSKKMNSCVTKNECQGTSLKLKSHEEDERCIKENRKKKKDYYRKKGMNDWKYTFQSMTFDETFTIEDLERSDNSSIWMGSSIHGKHSLPSSQNSSIRDVSKRTFSNSSASSSMSGTSLPRTTKKQTYPKVYKSDNCFEESSQIKKPSSKQMVTLCLDNQPIQHVNTILGTTSSKRNTIKVDESNQKPQQSVKTFFNSKVKEYTQKMGPTYCSQGILEDSFSLLKINPDTSKKQTGNGLIPPEAKNNELSVGPFEKECYSEDKDSNKKTGATPPSATSKPA